MPVKINFSERRAAAQIESAFQRGLPLLTAEIRDDCNEYCKMDTGTLIASSMIHSQLDKGLIIWRTPYARRQYWEIRTAYTDHNPKATWKWAHAAKRDKLGEWTLKAQRMMEMNL